MHRTLRIRFRSAFLVTLMVVAIACPAFASGPCYWVALPPFYIPVLVCPGSFIKIDVSEPCLMPIDEQDVILCPRDGQASPTEPFVGLFAPDPGGGTASYGVGIGIEHPDPLDPQAVTPIHHDGGNWSMHLVRAVDWDTGEFTFDNAGIWTPPAMGTFASHFGPDADYAIIYYAQEAGATPMLPGDTVSFDVHGLDADTFPTVVFGDGAVLSTGNALLRNSNTFKTPSLQPLGIAVMMLVLIGPGWVVVRRRRV